MKVVITGATGNVGTSVLRSLDKEPDIDEIVGVARRRPALEFPKTTWRRADVSTDDLTTLFRGADAVIHLAWLIQPSRDPDTLRRVNVEGSTRVMRAVVDAGVPALIYASSVGAYSPGPKDRAVDESWPTEGVATSFYGRHKAEVERLLDSFETEHPDVRVVRLRPALIFKREAASEIRRLFAGPLLPSALLRRSLIPIVPNTEGLRFQAVHSYDVGEAYRLATTSDATGPFNIAADPVLDAGELARLFGATRVRVPSGAIRTIVDVTWRLRLQPTPAGWVDMGLQVPIMDSSRARRELGWEPARSSKDALLELVDGMRDRSGLATPPLDPAAGGILRSREVTTGVGRT